MTTIVAMEQRRQTALYEIQGLQALGMERDLLPYEGRMLRKWTALVAEMDERLGAAWAQERRDRQRRLRTEAAVAGG